jgi:hypothetical protein
MPILNAIGSSLLSVGSFGLTTAVNYALSGLVDWTIATLFIAGGVVGGFIGLRAGVEVLGRSDSNRSGNCRGRGCVSLYSIYGYHRGFPRPTDVTQGQSLTWKGKMPPLPRRRGWYIL